MIILGIETSCDETAVSIVKAEGDFDSLGFEVLGSSIHSQVEIHKEFGGVVPMLAKREHEKNLPLVLEDALKKSQISMEKIDTIFVTVGPGLEPALWTGITFAKELGEKFSKRVLGANHMEGHIASILTGNNKAKMKFPALALLISGGHTEIIYMKNWIKKEKIGETHDDAVGEAFDKVARMLDLPYPGGPEISRLAKEAREKNIKMKDKLPRPMIHSKDLNFSFSGLKTAVLYYIRDLKTLTEKDKLEIAREFEDAVIDILMSKISLAIESHSPKTLIIGGGVIANKELRENFLNLASKYSDLSVLIPESGLTTDNATMIAMAGYIESLHHANPKLKASGNLSL